MKIVQIREEVEFTKLFKTEGDVIIDFFANWCMPCKVLSKTFDEISKTGDHEDITLIKVDIEKFPDIARSYNVKSLPTIVFTKTTLAENPSSPRETVKTKVGSLKQEKILELIGDIYG